MACRQYMESILSDIWTVNVKWANTHNVVPVTVVSTTDVVSK